MARIDLPDGEQPEVVRALMLRPQLASAVAAYNNAVFASALDWRLHELVRMRVAQINACGVCLSWRTPEAITAGITEELLGAVGDYRDNDLFTAAEQVALEFTERFCTDSSHIDDELIDRLRAHYDSGEVVELALVVGKYLSQGRFMQVLDLDGAACQIQGRADRADQ
jgi:AhpD family alkylhydroperoxidase